MAERASSGALAEVAGGEHIGAARSRAMLASSIGLIAGKLASVALGFLAWIVAARLFSAHEVGLAAGAVSAMMLCTQFALLGISSAVIDQFPLHRSRPMLLLDTSIGLVSIAALIAGGIFLALAGTVLGELSVVAEDPLYASLFLAMCVLGTVGILFDQISAALRSGEQVVVRNLVSGAATVVLIAALPLVGAESSLTIFAAWTLGGIVMCAVGLLQLWRALERYRYRPRISSGLTRSLIRIGLPNYALTLAERAPGPILPVVVISVLSPTANAYWYAVWMMAWAAYFVPISVGLTVFAEAAQKPESLRSLIPHGIRSSLGIGIAGACVGALLAEPLLSLLGPAYAAAGTEPLRILLIGVIPITFVQAYFAACRAARRLGEAVATGLIGNAVAVLVAALAASSDGLVGMALGWVLAQVVVGAFASWRLVVVLGRSAEPAHVESGDLATSAAAR